MSNDLILKRKIKRNKKTGEKKYFFSNIGRLEYFYDFSMLHDYVFMEKKDDEIKSEVKSLENHLINLDEYFNENDKGKFC